MCSMYDKLMVESGNFETNSPIMKKGIKIPFSKNNLKSKKQSSKKNSRELSKFLITVFTYIVYIYCLFNFFLYKDIILVKMGLIQFAIAIVSIVLFVLFRRSNNLKLV